MALLPLQNNNFYHIYNRANGNDKIFRSKDNYRFFMDKYRQHISPVADTYCYCLMPNHFHFLICIKSEADVFKALNEKEIARNAIKIKRFESSSANANVPGFESSSAYANVPGFESSSANANVPGFQNLGRYAGWSTEKILSKQLSNFFNSYAKAYNKQYNRMGSLFIKNFKRKKVDDMRYMKNLIEYIHLNPVEANLAQNPQQYPYSSYKEISNNDNRFVRATEIIEWYFNLENFKSCHEKTSITHQ